ncbi:MAG: hypothetical protein OTJ97_10355 [SAR202 cluster bacterium]|nr:hypothetical protein [SAR202 cluster bacterium]
MHPSQFVLPLFVTDSYGPDYDIPGFAPNKQWSCGRNRDFDTLVSYLKKLQPLGLATVMLFGVAKDANSVTAEAGRETADERGSSADCEDCAVVLALRALRKGLPDLQLMADVCLCAATSHGHCGLLRDDPAASAERLIDNDATLLRLTDLALTEARAGAHWVCPSDMMDGRVDAIRRGLDKNGFTHVGILAYTSKKASCMYGPFRAAVDSKFKEGRDVMWTVRQYRGCPYNFVLC